jgi:hypothetical protein
MSSRRCTRPSGTEQRVEYKCRLVRGEWTPRGLAAC